MLTRAIKPSFDGLRNAAKQLLVWSINKKADFCTSPEEDDFFSTKKNRNSQRRDFFTPDHDDYDSGYRRPFRRRNYDDDDYRNNYRWNSFQRRSPRNLQLRNEDIQFNSELSKVVKDFYQPHPDVLNRPKEEIDEFRRKHDIKIFGRSKDDCPNPILNFNELNLPDRAMTIIHELDYSTPTPVQSQTWPIALGGKNMVGISRTGSGKTLGFVLPALIHIQNQPQLKSGEGPIALMIAPTRELVQQILRVVMPFARSLNLRISSLFGGASKRVQIQRLSSGTDICIATPGRLNDVLNENFISLNRCSYLVLDEADRLLDMGFHPQIKSIFHYSRPDKQVLMWSATWPREVQSLAENFLRNYIAVKFGSAELAANPNIKQFIHLCEEREKFSMLEDLLKDINQTDDNKTIIFVQTKLKADRVQRLLFDAGYSVAVIHGDKTQMERDRALNSFRKGMVKILVGTLVVGRGIDIDDIRYVINYDFPNDIEDYVHIIGRTARKDNPGTSHSFFTYQDQEKAQDLIKVLEEAKQEINPDLLSLVQDRYNFRGKRRQSPNRYSSDWD